MRFLGDESCDHSIVRALRVAGHDVLVVSEVAPRAEDDAVLALARAEPRILLTEDRDFGQLVYADGHPTAGVLYVRVARSERPSIGSRIVGIVTELGERLHGAFVVVSRGTVRIRRLDPP